MRKVEQLMIEAGMVPVFNHKDFEVGCRVVQACFDAGLRVFEWTNRGEEALTVYRQVNEYATDRCPGMMMGVGSIVDGETLRKYVNAGVAFVVSPVMDPDLANDAREFDLPWIPGCGTATEIHQAIKWGAHLVKIFPGDSVGGPGFVKALLGPMPWLKIMPTGGVSTDPANLRDWFEAGVSCVGMGSKLFTPELIENPEQLTGTISQTLDFIRLTRNR